MANPIDAPLPLSYAEIEGLVKSLYNPGHAKKISETEATLRVLQRSSHGWQIADALLKSHDEQVRFFGALTLTVKLNADSAELTEEQSKQLLSTLINHLVSQPASTTTTRKISSTLAQYFTKPIAAGTECIRSLAVSFAVQRAVLDEELTDQPSTWDVLPKLTDDQLLVLIDFAMSLADETKRQPATSDRVIHERMSANAESVETLLHVSFGRGIKWLSVPINDVNYNQSIQIGEKICAAALKCFTGWIFYAQSEFRNSPEKLKHLRSATELALTCLEYQVEDAMELVAEVLENFPAFFETQQREMLWSAISGPWGREILCSPDAETASLARIIVAYAQILLDSTVLYKSPQDVHHQEVISLLHNLLKHPEPVGEGHDEVGLVALDFWSNFVNFIAEEQFRITPGEAVPWMDNAKTNVFQAISELLQKIVYPPSNITDSWDSDLKKTFKVFRVDVRDIIAEAYECLRDSLTDQFISIATQALDSGSWLELEAGLFGLISISDVLNDKVEADERLSQLFSKPLFASMSGTEGIPAVTRRATVELVAVFNSFFLRNPHYLPQVLPFLFSALALPSTAHSAAKSFSSLCSECRKSLTGQLDSFFQMYHQFLTYSTAEEFTKSKVLEGITAIVQALDTEEKQLAGIQHLFQFVAQDAMQAMNVTQHEKDAEQGIVLALTTLKCLHGMGRALQASDDEIVDLDSEKETSTFWAQGPGKEIQNQIINMINYLTQIFPSNDEMIEAACNILRCGFKETIPGPFVLPPSAAVDFIVRSTVSTPRLPYVLDTACCLISSHRHNPPLGFLEQAQRLLRHDIAIMHALQNPRNDPEISVGCIELIQSFINSDPRILLQESSSNLSGMFEFTVESIRSPEVLSKRAAARLWKDIFELAGNTHNQHQGTTLDIAGHFGSAVTFALMSNVCGDVDLTSFDYVVAPLRALIKSDKNARLYISESLAQQPLFRQYQQDPMVQELVRKSIEGMIRNAKSSSTFKETAKALWQSCKQLQMQAQPHTVQALF